MLPDDEVYIFCLNVQLVNELPNINRDFAVSFWMTLCFGCPWYRKTILIGTGADIWEIYIFGYPGDRRGIAAWSCHRT